MILSDGTMQSLFTISILVAFVGLVLGIIFNRKNIREALRSVGLTKRDIAIALAITIFFVALEIYLVKPTQLLFFDDAIYQGMALDLLHSGQAWMCNYGTPSQCFSGQIFHEPVGLSFNIAIGFLVFGLQRGSAYITELALAAISVFMCFFSAALLFRDRKSAIFSALILALSPIVLAWAMPTNSDMATLAYSLLALFMMLIFIKRRNALSLLNFLLALALLLFMKVDALVYIPIFAVMLLLLVEKVSKKGIKNIFHSFQTNILETKYLIAILIFIVVLYPSIFFAFSNYANDGYGYQGAGVQLSCAQSGYMTAKGAINLANFKANICANTYFWLNAYKSQYIIQPIYFTALAILGAALMIIGKKGKELLAIAIWFGVIFLLYTAFYAGAVTFGVDWRFMLGLIAQTAMLGGFALGFITNKIVSVLSKRLHHKKSKVPNIAGYLIGAIFIISLLVTVYMEAPLLSIDPSKIQQAGGARFYENFVYNNTHLIPTNCLVYTYDPTLFNINNRSGAQLSYLYDASFYSNTSSRFSCAVVDMGYWCTTPNNICSQAQSSYHLTPIATANDPNTGFTYGLYKVN